MEEYKVKQIAPNHAEHVSHFSDEWLDGMFQKDVIAQRKYDGERMLVHFNGNEVYCTSRRFSKKTGRYMENQDRLMNLPTLTNVGYTVIDCECYAKDWSTIAGILHSLPERAFELQKKDWVKFAMFDCLFYNGKDLRNETYEVRLQYLHKVYLDLYHIDTRFHLAVQTTIHNREEMYAFRDELINEGYEGIVVKPLYNKYYDKGASIKCKRFETVDVVVYSYQQGCGKYANTIGALLVGYYDPKTDSIIHMSKVNCGTDADRDLWRDNWEKMKNTVLEVKCQEITKTSLRHPVYVRIRNDKDYHTCLKNTIFEEEN